MIDLLNEISLDRKSGSSMTRQLIEGIRKLIHDARLAEGDKLPSTRDAASGLGLSRNIVAVAYDQLTAEGYLAPKKGAGTFVASGVLPFPDAAEKSVAVKYAPDGSGRIIHFNAGNPDLASFPIAAWANTLKRVTLAARAKDLGYAPVQGSLELRRELASYLYRARGIACSPQLIVVVSGLTQALMLFAGLRDRRRRRAILEDPSLEYVGAALARSGFELLPVPADEAGLRTQELPANSGAELVYVVPTHQYPLGGILPIQRRRALIAYAGREDAWILEDDYDSEFRYEGALVEPLQVLAPERVAYFGTFSKTLYPAIRLGYLVVPELLVERVLEVKRSLNLFSPCLEQLAVAEWLRERKFESHVYRMKKLYKRRRERMVQKLSQAFGDDVRVLGENAGLHVLVEFPHRELDASAIEDCRGAGLDLDWVEETALISGRNRNRIVIGYGSLTDDEIDDGVRRLRSIL